MEGYDAATYGERVADVYDEWYGGEPPAEMVDVLAAFAGAGRVLELGIGTGRVALPLADRGLEVHGIDASEAMVAKLRAKPAGDQVTVTIADFADVPVDGPFRLVFVVFNTFFGLLTQDEQVRCFENVARRLAPDGVFVLEAFVPDPARFDGGQRMGVIKVEVDEVHFEASRYDAAGQRVNGQHLVVTPEGVTFHPLRIRFAWPSELDLMARLAGLRLRERWSGWAREPFDARSTGHVSVYARG